MLIFHSITDKKTWKYIIQNTIFMINWFFQIAIAIKDALRLPEKMIIASVTMPSLIFYNNLIFINYWNGLHLKLFSTGLFYQTFHWIMGGSWTPGDSPPPPFFFFFFFSRKHIVIDMLMLQCASIQVLSPKTNIVVVWYIWVFTCFWVCLKIYLPWKILN
jgi:hypothetical protein